MKLAKCRALPPVLFAKSRKIRPSAPQGSISLPSASATPICPPPVISSMPFTQPSKSPPTTATPSPRACPSFASRSPIGTSAASRSSSTPRRKPCRSSARRRASATSPSASSIGDRAGPDPGYPVIPSALFAGNQLQVDCTARAMNRTSKHPVRCRGQADLWLTIQKPDRRRRDFDFFERAVAGREADVAIHHDNPTAPLPRG